MLNKLALRNVLRSARDYMVYFLTMMLVTAIMFAFHSLIFSEDLRQLFEMALLLAVLIGLASFFVVLIVAWLINYMVRFILEKRSREFGIYLLIGMKKKEIAKLYLRESLLLGVGAFGGGLLLGLLLQQILMAILYSCIQMEYRIRLEWNPGCLATTAACYGGCYLLALLRCRRRFRKMNIHALMNRERLNEQLKESRVEARRWLLPLSGLGLLGLGLMLFFYKNWSNVTILGFLAGLVLVIYLFYSGLAARIVCYVRKKGNGVFHGQNLFLLRQFASKVRTLRFTLGTLTSLFVLALLGCAIALMFNDFQNQMLAVKWPFDVQIFSGDTEDDFRREWEVLEREAHVEESHTYFIYQNGTNPVNTWLCTHLRIFGDDYLNSDGTPNQAEITSRDTWAYYRFDTYIALSDYNRIREMAGLYAVALGEGEYLLHLKERVWNETGDFTGEIAVSGPDGGTLRPAGIRTEPLSQDGHNGADYLLVVSDEAARQMTPYYRMLVANLAEKAPGTLQQSLDALESRDSYEDFGSHRALDSMASGTDQIAVYVYKNMVRDNLIPEAKFLLSSVIFALVYAGLVFVCVALTVLSVQQLSDSARYRFRYQVLHQIGLSRKEISGVILKQLALFYLCPILFAALVSGIISVYLGWMFNFYTGTHTAAAGYFGVSFLMFLSVYGVYFAVTYVGFQRNVLTEPGS